MISRIRHVAADIGDGSFSVQTIARVGYRSSPRGVEARARVSPYEPIVVSSCSEVSARRPLTAIGSVVVWRAVSGEQGPPPEAKLLYDRADALRSTGLVQDNRQALAYLREAVRVAPEYGEAWGALALAYNAATSSESPDRVEGFEELRKEAIRQAELHDPGNADAAAAQLPHHDYGRWIEVDKIYRD